MCHFVPWKPSIVLHTKLWNDMPQTVVWWWAKISVYQNQCQKLELVFHHCLPKTSSFVLHTKVWKQHPRWVGCVWCIEKSKNDKLKGVVSWRAKISDYQNHSKPVPKIGVSLLPLFPKMPSFVLHTKVWKQHPRYVVSSKTNILHCQRH